jgi:hypothetical protein
LNVRGTGITDASVFSGMAKMEVLDLRDNRLISLGSLVERPPERLLVSGNPLNEETCLALINAGRRLRRPHLLWQGASLLGRWRTDPSYILNYAEHRKGSRYAILVLDAPVRTQTEAGEVAARYGARLGVVPDADAASDFSKDLLSIMWTGGALRSARQFGLDGNPLPYTQELQGNWWFGYQKPPTDGGGICLRVNKGFVLPLSPESQASIHQILLEWP